jgi:hypothetical protein
MGVTLACSDIYFQFSYSFLHITRYNLLEATEQYLKNLDIEEKEKDEDKEKNKKKLIQLLNECHVYNDNLNYRFIIQKYNELTKYLIEFHLVGLYWFVNHSDNDSFFSIGQAFDMKELITKIHPYLTYDAEDTEKDKILENYFLFKLCVKSIESNKIIEIL